MTEDDSEFSHRETTNDTSLTGSRKVDISASRILNILRKKPLSTDSDGAAGRTPKPEAMELNINSHSLDIDNDDPVLVAQDTDPVKPMSERTRLVDESNDADGARVEPQGGN